MEVGSGGGPKIQLEGKNPTVFGISIGGYFDTPLATPTADYTLLNAGKPYYIDVVLPEPGRTSSPASHNRGIILGMHHSCVVEMLAHI